MMQNAKKGVTMIELVVVMAVSAILLLVAVPNIGKMMDSAKLSNLESDAAGIKNACTLDAACTGTSKNTGTKLSDLDSYDLDSYDAKKSVIWTNSSGDLVYYLVLDGENNPIVNSKTEAQIKDASRLNQLD